MASSAAHSPARSLATPSPSFLPTPDSEDDLAVIAGGPPRASYKLHALDADGTRLSRDHDDDDDGSLLEDGGYELQNLDGTAGGASERAALLDDAGDPDAVVYDAFGEDEDDEDMGPVRLKRRPRQLFTADEERAVVKRLDRYLVGGLAVLYMLSFLDRSNIGNAYIAGMKEDLGLAGDRYQWLLMGFYVTYILFEWMTLCYKMFRAHIYIALCVAGWGVLASLQAVAFNWQSMLVLRLGLGFTEAAFGPGIPFYLSLFYRREELALRTGLFVSAAPLATAYAGLLAYAITSIKGPIAPWRILYLVEGFPSIVVAIVAFYWVPDTPKDCRFLDYDQKRIAHQRVQVVSDDTSSAENNTGLNWVQVRSALLDPGNWLTALLLFAVNTSFASLPVFLPTIIHEFGYSAVMAQALVIPPYIFAFGVILLTTWLSDRVRSRSWLIVGLTLTSAAGYALLAAAGTMQLRLRAAAADAAVLEHGWLPAGAVDDHVLVAAKYSGVMLTAGCIFALIALIIVWNGNNAAGASARGTGMAMQQYLGQCGSLLGTRFYPAADGPAYVRGSVLCAAFMGLAAALTVLQRARLARLNRRAEMDERAERARGQPGAPGWRYML